MTASDATDTQFDAGSKIALFQKAKPFVSGGRIYELLQVCHLLQKRGDLVPTQNA